MKNIIAQDFPSVQAIRMDVSSQERLKRSVEAVAAIIDVAMARQEAGQGVWIDTGFGNGSALQQVVDILQSRFDYY